MTTGRLWTGRIIAGVLSLFLLADGIAKVLRAAPMVEGTAKLGFPETDLIALGIVQLACTLLYLIARTSLIGAIMLTGYLGGATAAHVRIGDPFWFPVVFGVLVWASLFLRDESYADVLLRGKQNFASITQG